MTKEKHKESKMNKQELKSVDLLSKEIVGKRITVKGIKESVQDERQFVDSEIGGLCTFLGYNKILKRLQVNIGNCPFEINSLSQINIIKDRSIF